MGARRQVSEQVRSQSPEGSGSPRRGRSPSPQASTSASRSPPQPAKDARKKSSTGSKGSNASNAGSKVTSETRSPRSSPQPARSSSPSEPSSPPRKPAAKRPPPVKFDRKRTSGEVWRCKKGKRTDIKPVDWDKYGYALNDEPLTRPIVYEGNTVPIPRVKRKDITPEWFYENAAKPHMPFIVEGVTDGWPAMKNWSIDAMEERFRHVSFKVAKDDKGKKLRMKFKYYADYIRKQQDDSPLYLFETNVDDNASINPIVNDFRCPDIFPFDWMNLVNEDSRPPHRWFCIGPKRSGTTVHIDPLATAAWNVVTHGHKHWVLFHPSESKKVVKGKDVMKSGEDDEAIMYFDFVLPRIKKAHPELRIWEGMQNPGEVIFVPGDWWHGVVNTEDCVAITQNYVGPDNFEKAWVATRKEREKVAWLWLRNMRKYAPQLYDRAIELNRRDNFRMRHERPAGERLSAASSSSSESSTDSSSDGPGDLIETGLVDADGRSLLPEGVRLGRPVWRKQDRLGKKEREDDSPKEKKKRRTH